MLKNSNESYIEWRERVINNISPSFCGAKWGNSTIWLGSGMTASCHHPIAHKIPLEELKADHRALHNTKHKKTARQEMLDGVRTKECEACWSVERQGSDLVSDRVFKSVIYTEDQLRSFAYEDKAEANVTPVTMEISFDSLCNLACSYCSQDYSSTWAADLSQNGVYLDLTTKGHQVFTKVLALSKEGIQEDGSNPYANAFWKWWHSDLPSNLKELRVTGGEATMSPHFWRLLDWYEANPKHGPRLAVNSNMMPAPHLLERLIERSHSVREFELYTSCEATEDKAEYIRDGLKWQQWQDNVEAAVRRGNFTQTHCMMTLSALSALGVVDFMDYLVNQRKHYKNKYHLQASLNILRFPDFQSSYSLSPELRNKVADDFEQWMTDVGSQVAPAEETNHTCSWLNDFERPAITRYIAHLRSDAPEEFDYEGSRRDLISFLNQYDQRRGKDWRKVFPALHVDLEDQ